MDATWYTFMARIDRNKMYTMMKGSVKLMDPYILFFIMLDVLDGVCFFFFLKLSCLLSWAEKPHYVTLALEYG